MSDHLKLVADAEDHLEAAIAKLEAVNNYLRENNLYDLFSGPIIDIRIQKRRVARRRDALLKRG